jgi:nitrogen regulatory protein PII
MKAIMIIYNQAHTEKVEYMLDKLGIKGYSLWENVQGRGTSNGVPHLGTHTWPEVKKIDAVNEEVGIRAFVWDILKMV